MEVLRRPTAAHGAAAGALAVAVVIVVALSMRALGLLPATRGAVALVAASVLVPLGIVCGALYARLVRTPTVPSAIAWGLVPTAISWLIVAPLTGAPIGWGFGSSAIALSLLLGSVVWGGMLGGMLRARELRDSDVVQPAPRRLSRGTRGSTA